MKRISICNDEESIYLFSEMILGEYEIDRIESIVTGLSKKIDKLEKHAPPPMETRINLMEYSLVALWESHRKTNKILEEMKTTVSEMSRRIDFNRNAHTRMYKKIGKLKEVIDGTKDEHLQDCETINENTHILLTIIEYAGRKQEKRLSDVEEFIGDL